MRMLARKLSLTEQGLPYSIEMMKGTQSDFEEEP